MPPKVEIGLIIKITKTDDEWKKLLAPNAYRVLRHEDTERPYTNNMHDSKKVGIYYCAGCDLPLFSSEHKYDSRTGWPSFFTTIPGAFETKKDFNLFLPRTEYHCIRCGGHQGHIFDDGPAPTFDRWCNNGVALKFIPQSLQS